MNKFFIIKKMRRNYIYFSRYFEIQLISWIIGFFLGNLNGTFLNFFRSQKIWDGCFFFFLTFLNERISFLFYNKYSFKVLIKNNFLMLYWKFFIIAIQIRKIGFLFSIFIDAFKVGSSVYIIILTFLFFF